MKPIKRRTERGRGREGEERKGEGEREREGSRYEGWIDERDERHER